MGVHQDIQDKVIEELDQIFGDSDRPATFQDTLEMKYLERCLMETLRMYPPVPIIARHIKQDITLRKCPHNNTYFINIMNPKVTRSVCYIFTIEIQST